MRAQIIDLRVRSSSDPATVFAVVKDRSAWPSFTSVKSFELERPGDDEPFGQGSIGRLKSGPLTAREQIVGYIPNRRISYVLLSGIPVRQYRGDVEFAPDGVGTSIHWRASLSPSVPGTGWLLRRLLGAAISGLVGELAAEADRRATS
jgi:hypothetical protein